MKQKLLGMLSISRKAGKLVLGFDPVKRAVFGGEAVLVLGSFELSPKTSGEMQYFCREYQIPFCEIPVTVNEIWFSVSKKAGVLAITDVGLAEKIKTLIPQAEQVCGHEED